jgi:hypothetical protein
MLALLGGIAGPALGQIPLPVQDPEDLDVTFDPIWDECRAGSRVPVAGRFRVTNTGEEPDAGVLEIGQGDSRILYPLQLPVNSTRELEIYVPNQQTGQLIYTFRGQGGDRRGSESYNCNAPETVIGVISDAGGLGGFLEVAQPTDRDTDAEVSDARPEHAPTKAIGYQPLSAVILASGSERLARASARAIKQYVMAGGTLLVSGGGGATWLNDAIWADVLPARSLGVENRAIEIGDSLFGPVAVNRLEARPTSDVLLGTEESPLVVGSNFGFGRVVQFAFEPLEPPFRGDPAVGNYLLDRIGNGQQDAGERVWPLSWQPWGGGQMGGMPYGFQEPDRSMLVSLPEPGLVIGMMVLYFLLVLPVNFVVLRKLGRRELAWVTMPLLALAFSAVFFYLARDLYQQGLSRSTTGTLIVREGSEPGFFVGRQTIFFPRGGVYDLGLTGVQYAEDETGMDPFSFRWSSTNETSRFIDMGELQAPAVETRNLGLKSILLTQTKPLPGPLSLDYRLEVGNAPRLRGTFTNASGMDIRDAALAVRGRRYLLGDLPANRQTEIDVAAGATEEFYGAPVLVGQVSGDSFGADIGREENQDGVELWYFFSAPEENQ